MTVRFILEPSLRKSAEAGAHNFIGKMVQVIEGAGLSVDYGLGGSSNGYSMTHMKPPSGAKGLVFRRVYHYPFWQIDQTDKRWNWDVAGDQFDGSKVDHDAAQKFYAFWQKRLFEDAPKQVNRKRFIYAPLQGRLTQHRSFQKCSPLEMLTHCLTHDDRKVIATLHPNEDYSATELKALEQLALKNPRLEIRKGGMVELLQTCDFIVTQNSSAAFNGMFFGKPSLLFAKIDFHHIAVAADMDDLARSFETVQTHTPDYAGYIHWFWQLSSINAGRPDAAEKIAGRLRRFGWPI